MSETTQITETLQRIFAAHAESGNEPASALDHALWKDLQANGFDLLGVPEQIGGSGRMTEALTAAIEIAAFHGARIPFAERGFLAGWLLGEAGIQLPRGQITVATDEAMLEAERGTWCISGRLEGVPWARHCDAILMLARHRTAPMLAVIDRHAVGIEFRPGQNLAGEPRDTLLLESVPVNMAAPLPSDVDIGALRLRGALLRAVQMTGAARAVLEATTQYVTERKQFGRTLDHFQAVQHHLVELAAEVVAMRVSAASALQCLEIDVQDAVFGIAAAKASISASAYCVARIGHQLHGAMGFAQEHRLGTATTRLWSWREEFGNEDFWRERLAGIFLEDTQADLWGLVADHYAPHQQ